MKAPARLILLSLFCLSAARAGTAAPTVVRVGSKAFTESVILGELARELIRGENIPVEHRAELGGTRILWDALQSGEIDLYPEYTGTLTEELLPGAKSSAELAAELHRRGLGMTGSLGFSDGYAIGMRKEVATREHIRTITELAQNTAMRMGVTNEFRERADGWPGLRARYGITQTVRGMDHPIALRALRAGEIDATDLYTTDPEIQSDDLVVLEDDLHYFPSYDAVFLYREALRATQPRALAALQRAENSISAPAMIALNARARFGKVPETAVAATFAHSAFGIADTEHAASVPAEILRRLREHLAMVGASLAAACMVAIPLGILASRGAWLGELILGALGVIQTIPALALLVLLIQPLKALGLPGLGTVPATIALFLYSLLPIARNTAAGLTGISPALIESAESLGMGRLQRLWLIELPLALPTMLAGIQTAAVINVGFATLGALIGAGGFGQPILAGIRLDNYALILEGALPSAALALAVQALFGLVGKWLIPRGLRH